MLQLGILGAKQDRETGTPEQIIPARGSRARQVALFAVKLLVTVACFWYLAGRIDMSQALSAIPSLDRRWLTFAALLVVAQIPLVGMRWYNVADALRMRSERITQTSMIAIVATTLFFAQLLPSVAVDGVRAWLLARLGCDWRNAVLSVVIDRGVGVGLLVALGFFTLLLPWGLAAFGEYHDVVVVVYGGLLLAGMLGLLLAPKIELLLARWRYSRWLATLAAGARYVLLGPRGVVILAIGCLVHGLTIVIVWSLGHAQGLALPISDAAVLFAVMMGVALIPITISGWGFREIAVISLLGDHGVAPEQALLFSVSFGLILAVGSLPGALTWMLYSFAPARHYSVELEPGSSSEGSRDAA